MTQPQLLKANEDAESVARNELAPPIVGANVLRLFPHSHTMRSGCLRLALLACQYDGKFPSERPEGTSSGPRGAQISALNPICMLAINEQPPNSESKAPAN